MVLTRPHKPGPIYNIIMLSAGGRQLAARPSIRGMKPPLLTGLYVEAAGWEAARQLAGGLMLLLMGCTARPRMMRPCRLLTALSYRHAQDHNE